MAHLFLPPPPRIFLPLISPLPALDLQLKELEASQRASEAAREAALEELSAVQTRLAAASREATSLKVRGRGGGGGSREEARRRV